MKYNCSVLQLLGLLGLVVGDGGVDGVLGQHGAVQLHRRQRQMLRNVAVLDLPALLQRLALQPLGRQRRRRNRAPASKRLSFVSETKERRALPLSP